jgi:hypothetical protein
VKINKIHLSFTSWLFLSVGLLLIASSPAAGTQEVPNQVAPDESDRLLASTGEKYDNYEIVTVLPRDAIPAIDNPKFLTLDEANESYQDDELILGVEFNGDARAYSIPLLSSHEIVNDTVGGEKIAVTW